MAAASETEKKVDADLAAADMEIDCVVCMDCTGSMGSWIAAAKATAIKTAEDLRASIPGCKFRLGFLGYRDHCDSDRFVHIALSEDVAAVQTQLRPVNASGGGDAPEDVAGGLNKTLNDFDWKGAVKLVLMVADAPAHGSEYNDYGSGDSYPGGDPGGLDPKTIVGEMAKRGMDFTFIKCNSSTDKMIKALSDAYEAHRASEDQAFSVQELSGSQGGSDYLSMPSISASFSTEMSCPPPGGIMRKSPAALPPMPMMHSADVSASFTMSHEAAEDELCAPERRMAVPAPPMAMRSMAMPSASFAPSMPMMPSAGPSMASAAYAPSASAADSLHSALTSSITRSVKARVARSAAASGGGSS